MRFLAKTVKASHTQACARSSIDRVINYGFEGWGFKSFRAGLNEGQGFGRLVPHLLSQRGWRAQADPSAGSEQATVSRAITAGVAHGTWRSVKGDRLASGLSPFYFFICQRLSLPIERRSGLPSTARVERALPLT